MSTRLILICHAATEATRLGRFPADEDLDSDGEAALLAQAELPAGRIILSGPERRATRTALELAGREATVEPALRDWDLGTWAGRTTSEVFAADADGMARWLSDPESAPHGGESLDALIGRIGGILTGVAARGGRIVGVTHPAVVRAAIVVALGVGPTAFWHIDAAPLSRVRLSHDGRRWVLQALMLPTSESA